MVGKKRCAVVDTYWQTETGGIIIAPLPGGMPKKPGSASCPFFGIEPVLIDPQTGKELPFHSDNVTQNNNNDSIHQRCNYSDISVHVDDHDHASNISTDAIGTGLLCIRRPWPGMARTIYKNHARYESAYLTPHAGYFFTGDGANRDSDGLFYLTGRVDDVINVSGHRLSTCEIEDALSRHPMVSESAILGEEDDISGQAICGVIVLKEHIGQNCVESLKNELKMHVRKVIGPIATPKHMFFVSDLPKTRSGKIMRRILRTIVRQVRNSPTVTSDHLMATLGDLSTLNNVK